MNSKTLIKNIFSTATYIVILLVVLELNNLALQWLLINIILPFFDWFYSTSWIIKIFIGFALLSGIFGLISFVIEWVIFPINILLSKIFIENNVIGILSQIICSINIIWCIYKLSSLLSWDFWVIFLWIHLLGLIILMNTMLIYIGKKDF